MYFIYFSPFNISKTKMLLKIKAKIVTELSLPTGIQIYVCVRVCVYEEITFNLTHLYSYLHYSSV